MCRLIYYELAKIWRKRSLALSVCVLLILNLFLLWYVNCSNGENVPLSAYKSFQNEIAEMSEIEKGDYISNLKETMDGVCLVQNVLDMQKMQGESGKALAEREILKSNIKHIKRAAICILRILSGRKRILLMNFIMNSRKRQVMRNICSLCREIRQV